MADRVVLALTGADRVDFLQGLITNDVSRASGGIIYAALLTPQGKYIADFFVLGRDDALWIDVDAGLAATLTQRLNMYRLRADVQISQTDLIVSRGLDDAPVGSTIDPRGAQMGWRLYGDSNLSQDVDWDAVRVAHQVPAFGTELTPDTYILEVGFERLNGVDFRKGCYVGQEIVARMKHKAVLKKGLAQVRIDGAALAGDAITAHDKPVGVLQTVSGKRGLAYLRFERAQGAMQAGNAVLHLV